MSRSSCAIDAGPAGGLTKNAPPGWETLFAPGPKPVTATPVQHRPMSPLIVVTPVFVMVEPAISAKVAVVPSGTTVAAGAAAVMAKAATGVAMTTTAEAKRGWRMLGPFQQQRVDRGRPFPWSSCSVLRCRGRTVEPSGG